MSCKDEYLRIDWCSRLTTDSCLAFSPQPYWSHRPNFGVAKYRPLFAGCHFLAISGTLWGSFWGIGSLSL